MGYFKVKELQKDNISDYDVQKFLLSMIKEEYGYGFTPTYHHDIVNMEKYYLEPKNNKFFLAIHHNTHKLIGTIGISAYDKDFPILKGLYNPETTASISRVFVDKPYRRNGIASSLVECGEKFCKENGYEKIYLHTHKTVNGALNFWLSNNYRIVEDTDNNFKTVHMDKNLI